MYDDEKKKKKQEPKPQPKPLTVDDASVNNTGLPDDLRQQLSRSELSGDFSKLQLPEELKTALSRRWANERIKPQQKPSGENMTIGLSHPSDQRKAAEILRQPESQKPSPEQMPVDHSNDEARYQEFAKTHPSAREGADQDALAKAQELARARDFADQESQFAPDKVKKAENSNRIKDILENMNQRTPEELNQASQDESRYQNQVEDTIAQAKLEDLPRQQEELQRQQDEEDFQRKVRKSNFDREMGRNSQIDELRRQLDQPVTKPTTLQSIADIITTLAGRGKNRWNDEELMQRGNRKELLNFLQNQQMRENSDRSRGEAQMGAAAIKGESQREALGSKERIAQGDQAIRSRGLDIQESLGQGKLDKMSKELELKKALGEAGIAQKGQAAELGYMGRQRGAEATENAANTRSEALKYMADRQLQGRVLEKTGRQMTQGDANIMRQLKANPHFREIDEEIRMMRQRMLDIGKMELKGQKELEELARIQEMLPSAYQELGNVMAKLGYDPDTIQMAQAVTESEHETQEK